MYRDSATNKIKNIFLIYNYYLLLQVKEFDIDINRPMEGSGNTPFVEAIINEKVKEVSNLLFSCRMFECVR